MAELFLTTVIKKLSGKKQGLTVYEAEKFLELNFKCNFNHSKGGFKYKTWPD